ncbi:N-(5'-phosphoribosyl)anthranilate isomerase [Rhodovulum adriaticum]|uniref:N-(5'-phosphoribosyl)anthranilate isomerase n=1 Tax=Rhodovulum adriaticum TaxID=35804 RepID=UPI0010527510|nr:N-(5'-phosphoribosyl)anthranilate isomerase [Rhodovulum adriaticum]MBK1634540.1 hypothetical protein [Rhodovulum adriaticum]
MTYAPPLHSIPQWLAQIFAAKSVGTGGVVRRRVADVERKVGRRRLELEVRRRGCHLIECATPFVIVCARKEIRVIC